MPNIVALTEQDSRERFPVNPGDIVTVSLDQTPSTGFHWENEASEGSPILFLGSTYMEQEAKIPGAGGVNVFAYQLHSAAHGEGRIELSLKDARQKVEKKVFFIVEIGNPIQVLAVVDALGASAAASLENNFYFVDSHKYTGAWEQDPCELTTRCRDQDVLQWTLAAIDPDSAVQIESFGGSMTEKGICVPVKQNNTSDNIWRGRIRAGSFTGPISYSIRIKIDETPLSVNPSLDVLR